MYNYHPDIIWKVDGALLAAIAATIAVILLRALFMGYLRNVRRDKLLRIKNNVYEMVLSGRCAPEPGESTFIAGATPREFIDITTNRVAAAFFNSAERECFKKYFMTPEHVEKFEKIAKRSWSRWRRIEAILCLGYAGSEPAINALGKMLFDRDKEIAYFSMMALGHINSVDSAKALLKLLRKDPASGYKIASLVSRFPPDVADELIRLADSKSLFLRHWALTVLSKFVTTKYLKKLELFARDTDANVRAAACDCLAGTGLKEAIPLLRARLEDDSWLVKRAAISAIEKLMGDGAVSEVISLINDGSWSVCGAVKDVMASHIEASLPYIEKFLTGGDEIAKKYSIIALERSGYLTKLLRSVLAEKKESRETKLLKSVLKYETHFGLEAALAVFDPVSRAKAIGMLADMYRNDA